MLFVVLEAHGPGWDATRSLREQGLWNEHAAFMDRLVDEGFVRLGGPLPEGALLIVEAGNEADVRSRLHGDPWGPTRQLEVATIEPWEILLGELPA